MFISNIRVGENVISVITLDLTVAWLLISDVLVGVLLILLGFLDTKDFKQNVNRYKKH